VPRPIYILDASAIIPFLATEPDSKVVRPKIIKLLALRKERKAILRIPSFCMAECSKAFAAALINISSYDEFIRKHNTQVQTLLKLVSKRQDRQIESLYLNRNTHFKYVEEALQAQWHLKPRLDMSKFLSGFDALLISMATCQAGGREKVYIVTKDEGIVRVCNKNQDRFPRAIHIVDDEIPGT